MFRPRDDLDGSPAARSGRVPADDPNDCSVFAGGFTSIHDIAWHSFNDTPYAYDLAEDGALAIETGFEAGEFPPEVLLEVKANKRTELAEGQLSQP
ncbi:MAG: hypothetical protein ACRDKS_08180, partial [Actinomycetota bacterium]